MAAFQSPQALAAYRPGTLGRSQTRTWRYKMSRSVPFGAGGGIGRLYRRALGLSACLLAFISIVPARADPFFVTVYGRTYKVDPRYRSNEPQGPKPQEVLRALPPDMARGRGTDLDRAPPARRRTGEDLRSP
jgi:hypothetical protein